MSWLDGVFARFGKRLADRLPARFAGRGLALLLGLAPALGGCGFHPLYAEPHREVMTDLATVKVTPLTERIGQVMTTELQDGFNPSGVKVPPHYVLSVVLTRTRADLLIRTDGTASRTQYTVSATYTLRRVTDNAAVLTGSSRLVSGIDVNDN